MIASQCGETLNCVKNSTEFLTPTSFTYGEVENSLEIQYSIPSFTQATDLDLCIIMALNLEHASVKDQNIIYSDP